MSLHCSLSFWFICTETVMYFLLGYLLKYVYVCWERVCYVCVRTHSSSSTCTHSISQRASHENERAGKLKRQLPLCLCETDIGTKRVQYKTHMCIHICMARAWAAFLTETRVMLPSCTQCDAHLKNCIQQNIQWHTLKVCVNISLHVLTGRGTNTRSGNAALFSSFSVRRPHFLSLLAVVYSSDCSNWAFETFHFKTTKNLALKLNKDQQGKLPRKTSVTHFPLEYMIRKFIYV